MTGDLAVFRLCEAGCGCRYGSTDPDRTDCGCGGPCAMTGPTEWGCDPRTGGCGCACPTCPDGRRMTGDLAVWLRAQLDADELDARADEAFTLADITAKRAIIDLHRVIPSAYPDAVFGNRPCCEVCSAGGEYAVAGEFPCATLRLLAQPYAGRPGWHNEWNI